MVGKEIFVPIFVYDVVEDMVQHVRVMAYSKVLFRKYALKKSIHIDLRLFK